MRGETPKPPAFPCLAGGPFPRWEGPVQAPALDAAAPVASGSGEASCACLGCHGAPRIACRVCGVGMAAYLAGGATKTIEVPGYSYETPADAEYADAFDPSSPHYASPWASQARADAAWEDGEAEARA